MVHGDVAGIEGTRRALSDWLDWMGLVDAGPLSRIDRYIGYYESYVDSHRTLDRGVAVQEEVRNDARAVLEAVGELRANRLSKPDAGLKPPRPKQFTSRPGTQLARMSLHERQAPAITNPSTILVKRGT